MRGWTALGALWIVGCAPFEAGSGPEVRTSLTSDRDADVVRVMTWNIETVGEPGSAEYDAALAMVDRLRPDVLALNEVADAVDADHAEWFAVDAGFEHYVVADGEDAFGADRNALLSVYPLEAAGGRTAAELSGDDRARDITRQVVHATVITPRGELDVVSMHWKSGWEDSDEFRRVLEGHRAVQSIAPGRATVLVGDWNDDLGDASDWPATFHSVPAGVPGSVWLGSDLWTALNGPGLPNDPFAPLLAADLQLIGARQRSGTDATRPVSGRRLDYLATTPGVEVRASEVFDCRDQSRTGGVETYGAPVSNDTCIDASDHLPVVADLVVGESGPVDPVGVGALGPGALVVSELLANPDACPDDTGEWVEVRNTTSDPVDLTGLRLVDASGNEGSVSGGIVPPGGLAVLVRGTEPCGPTATGLYGAQVSLNNGGDSLALMAGSVVLDSVAYPSAPAGLAWVPEAGCATQPTPDAPNAACAD
ncbi:MAG: lamin tail domain-containing protein [Myxococcota bacterium]